MMTSSPLTPTTLACCLMILFTGCKPISDQEPTTATTNTAPVAAWTPDQLEVKTIVERFLTVAGNYDLAAMDSMIADKANIGICILRDGQWKNEVITFTEYVQDALNRDLRPYYEPVFHWDILVNEGQLALVSADAILHSFGVPRTQNRDNFTLIREQGQWQFINLSFTNQQLPEDRRVFDLETFARSYAQAWSGVRPGFVSQYFEEEGSLQVNDGQPAVGREAIAEVARQFMTDLPDMVVSFDSLVTTSNGPVFHWTLAATNTGPGGTGNPVRVSGYEEWTLGENGRILQSRGHFPSEEYDRQIKGEVRITD